MTRPSGREVSRGRDVLFVLLAVAALLLCRHYTGPGAGFAHDHGANVSFSFGAFFLLRLLRLPRSGRAPLTALLALSAVWLQEVLQAIGLYPGVFDPLDLLADALGVGLALGAHRVTRDVVVGSRNR